MKSSVDIGPRERSEDTPRSHLDPNTGLTDGIDDVSHRLPEA